MRSIVVAYDVNRVIGSEGALPWAGQLPADMRHFRELTEGKTVIMGRKTFESLPEQFRPLPRRQNIIISLSQTAIEGAQVATSMSDAYAQAENEPIIIGGEQIYRLALPTVDQVFATEIFAKAIKGDAFFPELPADEWRVDTIEEHQADEKNKYDYSFITYRRNTATDAA